MEKQYQQLQPEERLTIASMHLQGSSMRAMARMLGRSPATVSGKPPALRCPRQFIHIDFHHWQTAQKF
jgi:IS30 family transposase